MHVCTCTIFIHKKTQQYYVSSLIVTRFAKKDPIHASNFTTFKTHNSMSSKFRFGHSTRLLFVNPVTIVHFYQFSTVLSVFQFPNLHAGNVPAHCTLIQYMHISYVNHVNNLWVSLHSIQIKP